jgi:dTDP-glucose 4,6-dehydratase
MRIVVTGGLGFIGSNFIRHILAEKPALHLVNVDVVTYAGNPANLANLPLGEGQSYRHERVDIADAEAIRAVFREHEPETVVHFAAESHVDRSIASPQNFLRTNVTGTAGLLEAAREVGVRRFLHVSTDEVYGSLGAEGAFTESSPIRPSSPYSASKASSDLLALSYRHTYGLPVIVTRCSNNYGPYQFPEKLIPLMITQALADRPLPVYGDGMNVRDWIHVEDHCRAIMRVLEAGRAGEVYNIGAKQEKPNLHVVKRILEILEKPEGLIEFVTDRLGHDRRYAIDNTKVETELGWTPAWTFDAGLEQTVRWYLDNRAWWQALRERAGDFREI